MMIGVEFYFEMSRSDLKQDICEVPVIVNEVLNSSEDESPAISNLRNKIVGQEITVNYNDFNLNPIK